VRKFIAVIDTINEWAGRVISCFILPCVIIILVDVVLRYGFARTTVWAHETSTFLFGIIGVAAGGYVFLHGGHIAIDVLSSRLSTRRRAILEMVISVFFFFFVFLVFWKGTDALILAIKQGQHTQSQWGPPRWPVIMFVPIGAILLLLGGISKFIKDIYLAIGNKETS